MLAEWTGQLIGQMHIHEVTRKMLADELGVTKSYVSMILNGQRNPPNVEQRFYSAFKRIIGK